MRKLLVVSTLTFVLQLSAGAQTKLLVSGQVGLGYLGNRHPHLALGLTAETTVRKALIYQQFLATPDVKIGSNQGHGFGYTASLSYPLYKDVGPLVGFSRSQYWSGLRLRNSDTVIRQYSKGGWHPYAGVYWRNSWYGSPGSMTVVYDFPTGCVYATVGNPCTITSARSYGITVKQEFELWPKLRIGLIGGWMNYGDQVNPNAPWVPQSRHNTRFATGTIRYELWSQR